MVFSLKSGSDKKEDEFMSYRADESAEQRTYKLAAIEFVRKAAERARERKALRDEYSFAVWSEDNLPSVA